MKKLKTFIQNILSHKNPVDKKHTTTPLADIEPILKSQLVFVYAFVNQKEKIRALGYNTGTRTFLIDHIGENRLNINSSEQELKELFSGWYNSPVTELAMNTPSHAGYAQRNGTITSKGIGTFARTIYKDQQRDLARHSERSAKSQKDSVLG